MAVSGTAGNIVGSQQSTPHWVPKCVCIQMSETRLEDLRLRADAESTSAVYLCCSLHSYVPAYLYCSLQSYVPAYLCFALMQKVAE